MKNVVYVIFGSIIVATGISYVLSEYTGKNISPSIIGMLLILIYVAAASFFDKTDEDS